MKLGLQTVIKTVKLKIKINWNCFSFFNISIHIISKSSLEGFQIDAHRSTNQRRRLEKFIALSSQSESINMKTSLSDWHKEV